MAETIYSIPIRETYESCAADSQPACPVCRLFNQLEENELTLILGGSMMEPDVRIQTNKQGFCRIHYDRLLTRKNRLGLALMLESHLDELNHDMDGSVLSRLLTGKDIPVVKRIDVLRENCYLCNRIADTQDKMTDNTVYLWKTDRAFRKLFTEQTLFCLPHYAALLRQAKTDLTKKEAADFFDDIKSVNKPYFDELRADVKHFIRKFDYQAADEPWGNAKNAPERAVTFLTGDLHKEIKEAKK